MTTDNLDTLVYRLAQMLIKLNQGEWLDPPARQALRQREAVPRLKALREWLIQQRLSTPDGGALARAIDYSLKRWQALARYAEDGCYPIDNNPVENAIRPVCLGKKNWLFAGSERAGQRAAAIQSLLATARLNGIEPFAWLKDTLEKLPTWPHIAGLMNCCHYGDGRWAHNWPAMGRCGGWTLTPNQPVSPMPGVQPEVL